MTQEIIKRDQIFLWVQQLADPVTRGSALAELTKRREVIPDLGVILWHSFGTVAALVQEVVSVYPHLNPVTLTLPQAHRASNVLHLLKSVAGHPETKMGFAQAQIPVYLLPFLRLYRGKAFESLRLASLRVLEALVKHDGEETTRSLLATDMLLHVLEVIEKDSRTAKLAGLGVLQSVLSTDEGLMRVCETFERFSRVTTILGGVVGDLARRGSACSDDADPKVSATLAPTVQCYLRLSQNHRAREALRRGLPLQLKDGTFSQYLNEDLAVKSALTQLLNNLSLCPFVYEIQPID